MLNILSQFINNFLISTQKDVVCAVRLVGCNEIGIQSSGKRDDSLQLWLQLLDQVGFKDLRSLAGIVKVHIRDVPSADLKITGFNHRDEVFDRLVHVTKSTSCSIMLESDMACSTLSERTVEIGALDTVLRIPSECLFVCKNTSNKCRAIVAAKSDEQYSELGHFLSSFDNVFLDYVLIRLLILIEDSESLSESRFNPFTVVGSNAASCLE